MENYINESEIRKNIEEEKEEARDYLNGATLWRKNLDYRKTCITYLRLCIDAIEKELNKL
ncbi:MAG: hypothetical protein PF549_02740 [Patescibacteria group bacterium]|jgi:hypothetical protein|nr:hypothetical protein [Patescibacteria group bacterium]